MANKVKVVKVTYGNNQEKLEEAAVIYARAAMRILNRKCRANSGRARQA